MPEDCCKGESRLPSRSIPSTRKGLMIFILLSGESTSHVALCYESCPIYSVSSGLSAHFLLSLPCSVSSGFPGSVSPFVCSKPVHSGFSVSSLTAFSFLWFICFRFAPLLLICSQSCFSQPDGSPVIVSLSSVPACFHSLTSWNGFVR